MAEQIPLAVQLPDDEVFASYVSDSNLQVVGHLQALCQQPALSPANQITFISGDKGHGKSHLLYALCQKAQLMGMQQLYVDLTQMPELSTQLLVGLESLDVLCLDNLDQLVTSPEWQEAVFDLINRIIETKHCRLVLTANAGPKALNFSLADLGSRLAWGLTFQLHGLSDDDKCKALQIRAERRGLNLSADVARYLLTHSRQDMGTLMKTLDLLDKLSLREQRKLTIPFVKRALKV